MISHSFWRKFEDLSVGTGFKILCVLQILWKSCRHVSLSFTQVGYVQWSLHCFSLSTVQWHPKHRTSLLQTNQKFHKFSGFEIECMKIAQNYTQDWKESILTFVSHYLDTTKTDILFFILYFFHCYFILFIFYFSYFYFILFFYFFFF